MLRILLALAVLPVLAATSHARGALPDTIGYNAHVRPILSDKCFACHGFDAKKREADLRLDTAEGALADRDGAKVIVPGKPDESELWRRVTSEDEAEMMPPPASHKALSAEEQAVLRKWIEQGARYQKHWAFEPPVTDAPPKVDAASAATIYNAIDAFIGERLQREGLRMSPEADRGTLIRRVAFTTTGLPPTLSEVEAYMADTSPDAYEKMLDRFLASTHYGEEMARHWLDVARYADTHGLHLDNERQMWLYRDWVIDAFNRNLSFDKFTIEQLAGDLLPNATQDQLIATGFNRCNVTTSEGGSIDAEYIFRYAVDRASTTMQTWMALTGGCAVCHDHKFDPLSQKEFYSFYAFFHSAADPAMDGNALLTQPTIKVASEVATNKLKALDEQIAVKQAELDKRVAAVQYADPATISPPPQPLELVQIWFDDEFPAGGKLQASPGHPTTFVTAEDGQVFSGKRALKRSDKGISQDVWDQATTPLHVSQVAKLFAHVWIDPKNLPDAIMLQYHVGGWKHRAVWGNYDAIPWGAANTAERVHMGALPDSGKWVRLEFPAAEVGLKPADPITGLAMTQFGGTVYWDNVGAVGLADPATDPQRSFRAWWSSVAGKDTPGIDPGLNQVAKNGPDKAKAADEQRLRAYYLQSVCVETKPQFANPTAELKRLRNEKEAVNNSIPGTFVFKDLPNPRDSFVMLRGAYDRPGGKVQPGVPGILPPLRKADPTARATRLDLAHWLVAPEQPLTARVTVNRFWQQVFGTGLVKSSSDFGSQGEAPSHPKLLDWLAVQFRESGWDVKSLVKLMLMSATFRQSSQSTPESHARDPENRLFARGLRCRLDAEQIRDNALFVSGLTNLEMGGKGVNPYQPPNVWEPVGFTGSNTRNYRQDSGPALYRRSIYTFIKRTAPAPFLVNFDAPNREQFCTRRERSNTPLQALQLMNDVQHVEAARALAERLLADKELSAEGRIAFAYRVVLSRKPETEELAIVNRQLTAHLARYRQDAEAAKKLISRGESRPKAELNPSELAAYTMVANMILNLDETLTRN